MVYTNSNKKTYHWALAIVVSWGLLLGGISASRADTLIYGANAYGLANIVEINLSQGQSLWAGNVAFETQAIDQDPVSGLVYYYDWNYGANKFGYWDPVSGSNTTVRNYDPAPGVYPKHMAFSPNNTLYILTNDDQLYTIDKETGDLTFEGQVTGLETGTLDRTGDFAFAPDGTLYVATYQSVYELNLTTFSTTLLYSGLLEEIGGFNVWAGLAYCDGLLYAANIRPNGESAMFSIDPQSGAVNRLFTISTFVNDLSSCPSSTLNNHPPELSAIGDQAVNEGASLEFLVDAQDLNGDNLAYSARNLPQGATFDTQTKTFSWTPGSLDIGDHEVEFVVTDDGTPVRSDTETVTISVNTLSLIETVTITGQTATQDTSIADQVVSTHNFGGSDIDLAVGKTSNNNIAARALLKWDLSSIPAGSTVVNAEMSLYSYNDTSSRRIAINAHRLLQPWVEGTLSNVDRLSDNPSSSCWIESGSGTNWDLDGASGSADRDLSILTTTTDFGIKWYSWNLTSAVQHWLDGDWSNNGIILESGNEDLANIKYFYTSEYQDASLQPKLVVDYVAPSGTNNAPILDPIGNKSVDEGVNLGFTVSATDSDGDNLTFSADALPTGASLDPNTGVFSWTPASGQAGSYSITFTVTDDGTPILSDSELISITVNAPITNNAPVLDPIGNQAVDEGSNLTFTVTASDPDNDNLTLSTDVLPTGASFNANTGVFSWTPTSGQAGSYDITFTVTDDGTPVLSDSELISITVNAPIVNSAPVLDPIGNQSVDEGSNLTFSVTASDPDNDTLTLSTDVLPTGANFNASTGVFSWTPSTGQAGSYDITFTVTDDGTPALSDSELVSITVNAPIANNAPVLDPIGNQSVDEGSNLTFTVTATDPDNDNLTLSTDVLPTGASFNANTGVFSWTPTSGQAGSYNITFTATDDGTPVLSDSEQIAVTVNAAGPVSISLSGTGVTTDTMIVNSLYSQLNFGESTNLYIGSMNQIARALIRWELSSIPAGATIVSAEMRLYSRANATGGQITINAHRVLQPWIEGTLWSQDRTLDNPDSVCWTEYGNGTLWEAEGASGASDKSQTALASATGPATGWFSWDVTSAVQNWVDGVWDNNGLILESNDETQFNAKIFVPSEYPDQGLIPVLNIEYTLP